MVGVREEGGGWEKRLQNRADLASWGKEEVGREDDDRGGGKGRVANGKIARGCRDGRGGFRGNVGEEEGRSRECGEGWAARRWPEMGEEGVSGRGGPWRR